LLAALAALLPKEFVAITINVYAVPFVRPLTVTGEDAPVPVIPLGLDTIVYPVIAPPPTSAGAVKVTDTVPLAPVAVAVPIVGALGTFNGKYEAVKNPA
jgi:hypothetical protein